MIVVVLAWISPSTIANVLGVAWISAWVLVVPIVGFIHALDLHKSSLLFDSARHRIVIWDTTAEQVPQNFLVGIGADATPAASELEKVRPKDGDFERSVGRHAHNIYLQIWFELGLVGATLAAIVGLMALRLISSLSSQVARIVAFGQFAVVASLLATSYSLWQVWLICAVVLSIFYFAMVHRSIEN